MMKLQGECVAGGSISPWGGIRILIQSTSGQSAQVTIIAYKTANRKKGRITITIVKRKTVKLIDRKTSPCEYKQKNHYVGRMGDNTMEN